jgi:cell division initiation protein
MISMEISPRELRDSEIREAFRGYHRDDVNDLLERAAATIDALSARVRELGERLAHGVAGAERGRTRELEEMLERTLLLAKRAAEEEVTEAQAKARQVVDDAEAKARRLIADAEFDVRRRVEEERKRVESELIDLGQRREVLGNAVAELERFEAEYRERMIRSIEADLALIGGRAPSAPESVPVMPDVEVPVAAEGVMTRAATQPAPDDDDVELRPAASFGAPEATEPPPPPAALDLDELGIDAPAPTANPAPTAAPTVTPAEPDQVAELEVDLSERTQPLMLDDDAFFAQLREAVSDDNPATETEVSFFDQDEDDAPARRDLFRRR